MDWTWSEFLLIGIAAVCAATDIARRKIYNVVVFPSLAAAVAGHAWTGGWQGLGHSLMGFGVGLAILLVPYLLGGMGAGDVKLLALVGALQGPAFVFAAAVYMALLGFALSVLLLMFRRETRTFFVYVIYTLQCWRGGERMPFPRSGSALSTTMPYGVAIAGGALLVVLWRGVVPV
ncbi:prepilin peptidase [Paenibacillus sp. TRM 82003]|nr:prepilin peptidase [Paenibacillus sp. TRM 82003]